MAASRDIRSTRDLKLPHLKLLVDDLKIRSARLNPTRDTVEDLLRVSPVTAHDGAGDHRRRVAVLPLDLSGRYVELLVKPGQQRLEAAALLLQRCTTREPELDRHHGDVHATSLAAVHAVDKFGDHLPSMSFWDQL